MNADKTTLNDLAIFSHEEEQTVFHHLDFTRTLGGHDWLKYYLSNPLSALKEVEERQRLLKCILNVVENWPQNITNGTIMVLQKFYETAIQPIPHKPGFFGALSYKFINGADYSLIKYSVGHFAEFIKGLNAILEMLSQNNCPPALQTMLDRIQRLLSRPEVQRLLKKDPHHELSVATVLTEGFFLRENFKGGCNELIEIYSQLDAFYSMVVAGINYHFQFPHFINETEPQFSATQLYHPLVPTPVSYNISLTRHQNFLFLTGANMSGKSTFIKAIGVAVYLAHVGMSVPAQNMELTLFDGLLSNIQVEDNIMKGESYFFNEVQRVRKTIEKISNGKKWLILIDELFKGTNVQDAMKCSTVVIEGLRKIPSTLFILSTHLYEIGESLKQYSNIQFRYFETEVKDDQLFFNYHLKEGISNDRLGYLILKKEGVVEMLQKL
jgi:DNA mismatch repair protein MutS